MKTSWRSHNYCAGYYPVKSSQLRVKVVSSPINSSSTTSDATSIKRRDRHVNRSGRIFLRSAKLFPSHQVTAVTVRAAYGHLDCKYSPNPWSGAASETGSAFDAIRGDDWWARLRVLTCYRYEESEGSGSAAFCSSVKRASDKFQGKNDSGLSAA